MKRSIMLSVGWLAASYTLFFAVAGLDFALNGFDWSPKIILNEARVRTVTLACAVSILGALLATWFLVRATRDRVSRAVSLIACLALVGWAIFWFPAERTVPAEPGHMHFFARESASPLWYRGVRVLLMSLPSVFWLFGRFRSWKSAAQQIGASNSRPQDRSG